MQSVTFLGEVQGGQIHTTQNLDDFEGQQVYVTLIVPDGKATARKAVAPAVEEAEILEEVGRIRKPRRDVAAVAATTISVGRRPPRIHAEEE